MFSNEHEFDVYRSEIAAKNPEISVILSTYNRCRQEGECESLLKRALDSILNQTFTNFELILIDDCSSDGTKDFCQEIALKDPRVHFFYFHQNSGLPAKRYNFGISVSRGKYLTFMFDDDQWELNALNDLYQGIEKRHKHCGMVYGLATQYRGSDRENVEILGEKWEWNKIHSHNFIANNTVIVKRHVIDLVGGYDEDPIFLRVCDWDLWWRIGRKFKVGRIESKIANVYSALPDSIGVTKVLNWEACKNRQKGHRLLPLKIITKEPLYCKIHSTLFDIYVSTCQRVSKDKLRFKHLLKRKLPPSIYQLLKKMKCLFANLKC